MGCGLFCLFWLLSGSYYLLIILIIVLVVCLLVFCFSDWWSWVKVVINVVVLEENNVSSFWFNCFGFMFFCRSLGISVLLVKMFGSVKYFGLYMCCIILCVSYDNK